MQKFYLLIIVSFLSFSTAVAQTDSLTVAEKAMLDSLIDNDEYFKMLKDYLKRKPFYANLGIGNGAFSAHNNAANATGVIKQAILLPSITYFTKPGFSFGITGFLTNDSNRRMKLYQTGLTAGYDYYGKDVRTGISYTRYLNNGKKYNSKSLYQNDIFAYIRKAEGVIKPGLSIGYVNGSYKETAYTSYRRLVHLPNPPPNGRDTIITISGNDSTDNDLKYFSVSANARHDFKFRNIFSSKDDLNLGTTVIVNFGSDRFSQTHTNAIFDRVRRLSDLKRVELNNKFQIQSLASSLDLTYSIDPFIFQSSLYLDYYLPPTTSKRISTIYFLSAGVSF